MHLTMTIAAALVAATLALTGCAVDEDPGNDKDTGSLDTSDKPGKGKAKKKGSGALMAGDWQILGKPRIKNEFGSFSGTLRAKNTSDEGKVALVNMTLIKGEDNVLGTLDCIGTGNEVAAGATTTMSCISSDDFQKGWTKIEFEDGGF